MFGNYKPDSAGMRALGQESFIGDAMLSAAQKGRAWAAAQDPDGAYEAQKTPVTVGWNNETRAGAAIVETKRSRKGPKERVLVRAANQVG